MAKTKALSTNGKRSLSNPKDMTDRTNQLEAKIALARRALKQKDINKKKYNEILEQGQEWARQKLETELDIKEYIEGKSDGRGGDRKSEKIKNLPNEDFDFKKTKIDIIYEELGLTKKQQEQISKLTRDGVDEAIENAIEAGDIPTRYSAIRCSNKLKNNNKSKLIKKDKMYINIRTTSGKKENFVLDFSSEAELDFVFEDLETRLSIDVSPYVFVKPPFNYPGGKSKLANRLLPILGQYSDDKVIVSPFLGAGALEINLANTDHYVIGYDYDPNIVNLWNQLLGKNEELKQRIHYFIKERIDESKYKKNYKKIYKEIYEDYFDDNRVYKDDVFKDGLDRAAIYWILTMTSFGAKIRGKKTGSNFFRNTKHDFVDRKIEIFNYKTQRFYGYDGPLPKRETFRFAGRMSFEESIPKHPDDFLYCDPPYMDVPPDYGESDIDHKLLADILNSRENWILSYNDIPKVRKLYKGRKMIELNVPYSLSNKKGKKMKIGKELLIFGPMISTSEM